MYQVNVSQLASMMMMMMMVVVVSRTVAFSPISLDSSSPSSATARTCVPCTSQRCELHRSDPIAISTHDDMMIVVEYDHDGG